MSDKIQVKIYESAVDPARIPGRAPTVLLLGPLHAGTQGFATNLSEEGYQVVLVDNTPASASLTALRRRPATGDDKYVSDNDLRETDGWCVAVNLVKLIDVHVSGGWNKYTALIALDVELQDADVVRSLHVETSHRGGLSAVISYGSHLTRNQVLEAVERVGDYPLLSHLAESETDLVDALVQAAKKGDIPQDSLPFHPELDAFKASLGPVKAKPVSVFTYTSIGKDEDASVWGCAFPFSHHSKDFAFPHDSSIGDAHRSAAAMSYSRTVALLKSTMGPRFPLEQLWDQHTYFEFATRDAAKTMSTMVAQPYVNHVACLTGGAGFTQLARFYQHHFTSVSPPDTALVPISRTIGADRIIDEMVFSCTHTTMIDYFLPGVPPTGRKLRIPMVGIVNLRGDKLAYESLYWDQSNALVQLGLLDPVKSSTDPKVRLPIAGDEVAQKILHPYGVPSNELMPNWPESESKGVPGISANGTSSDAESG
ncbi:dienelactone hydrolase [Pseudozyma hubeiensis SY62]|uniref:Dienelactone hydrolase n=1 Tax=Pseudozyma hubeiensis (strain SY62) TaxID=1305764 RepID=R9PG46_PSEHS|nr:dienelactone hydrolase [Pseudozyma hubeiensis SY62]GAC97090.1 dienelactone hydrolase [Pseudozyma hubeiensis SY62]